MNKIDRKYNKKSGIYMILNRINGKMYIGSSINVYERCQRHLWSLKKGIHHSILLQRSFNKYGCSNFSFNILEIVFGSDEFLRNREQFWMDFYQSYNYRLGFNMSKNAKDVLIPLEKRLESAKSYSNPIICYDLDGNFIKEFTSISRAEIYFGFDIRQSIHNLKSRVHGYIFRIKYNNNYLLKIDPHIDSRVGIQFSQERCNKISKAITGIKRSKETIKKIREAKTGLRDSKETRKKKSIAIKMYLQNKDNYKKRVFQLNEASKKTCKSIIQIDKLTNKKINAFNSIQEASKFLNKDRNVSPDLSTCCNGNQSTAFGYKWKYA